MGSDLCALLERLDERAWSGTYPNEPQLSSKRFACTKSGPQVVKKLLQFCKRLVNSCCNAVETHLASRPIRELWGQVSEIGRAPTVKSAGVSHFLSARSSRCRMALRLQ